MQVKDIMTKEPQCCTSDKNLVQAAKMIKDCDCGAIPVVNDEQDRKPIGIITDRDITIRAVAEGRIPSQTKVKECMSVQVVSISPEASLEQCAEIMEERQVRRLVVVNRDGKCLGIIVQAQVARAAPKEIAGELLKEISQSVPELART